jgi:hypothetical protein
MKTTNKNRVELPFAPRGGAGGIFTGFGVKCPVSLFRGIFSTNRYLRDVMRIELESSGLWIS